MIYVLLLTLHLLVCLCLVGVVMIQSGSSAGLSGAFGMGEGQAVFGSRAGDVLTKATEVFAILFMVLCLAVTWQSKHSQDSIMSGLTSSGSRSVQKAPLMTMEEAEKMDSEKKASESEDTSKSNAVKNTVNAETAQPVNKK